MRSLLVATAVLAAPLSALANPIYGYDFLSVRYQGTIDSVKPWGGGFPGAPEIGDRISGTLRVNLHALPPDEYPADAKISQRNADWSYGIPSFVSGHAATRGFTSDYFGVADNGEYGDVFTILDYEEAVSGPSGHQRMRTDALSLFFESKSLDFIHGDGPVQAFTITADSMDLGRGDSIVTRRRADAPQETWLGGVLTFVLDKVTVKPRQCSM